MPSYPTRLTAYPPAEESLKREVMTHFGHQCVCPGCGETTLHLLTLDHKMAGGNAERRAMKRWGWAFYREVKIAIDRDTPEDRTWLATLQILCVTCNRAKGTMPACPLHALPDENSEEIPRDIEELPEQPQPIQPSSTRDLADEKLVKLETRVPLSVKKYLQDMGCQNLGEAIAQIVADRRPETAETIVQEVRRLTERLYEQHAHQRQVNGELLTLLSDLCLKGSDPSPAGEVDAFAHRRPDYVPPDEPEPCSVTVPVPRSFWQKFWSAR
jgi:hypothetical protein